MKKGVFAGMDDLLITRDLYKRFGRRNALDGLSMQIPNGAIYGFVGRNGAGKTTLIRLLCGLIKPSEGEYELFGIQYPNEKLNAARRRIGAIVETPAMYLDMTASDNLRQQYRLLGLDVDHGIRDTLRQMGLEDTDRIKVRNFSLGMRQKLGIALAMAGDPEFLILDEPTNGLDPQGIMELREHIVRLNRERGITFLISSHILEELSKLATHFGFIDHGRMVKEMTADALEQACKKSTRVSVSSMQTLRAMLERKGIAYRVLSDSQADIFDSISMTRLAMELANEDCEIYSCWERNENLEEYFIDLVGGERNA